MNGSKTSAVRRSHIVWLDHDAPDTAWIAARLTRLVAEVNREVFNFALTGFDEDIQLTEYRAEVAGFYDWHADIGGRGIPQSRKLSLTVQLSDPADYDGGALELNSRGEPEVAPCGRGTAIAFPSYVLHRVTPVTRGVRRSLVVWVHGPDSSEPGWRGRQGCAAIGEQTPGLSPDWPAHGRAGSGPPGDVRC